MKPGKLKPKLNDGSAEEMLICNKGITVGRRPSVKWYSTKWHVTTVNKTICRENL